MHSDIQWVTSQKLTKIITLELIKFVHYDVNHKLFQKATDEPDAQHSWRVTNLFFTLSLESWSDVE